VGKEYRLCAIVEGVEFTVVEQDVCIRALILRDALETFFGAGDSPQSWLKAYELNRDAIDCAAADRHRLQRGKHIVVLRAERPQDFTASRHFA
jgi:hypothetical protein